ADLNEWPAARIDELRAAANAAQGQVQVTSARALEPAMQTRITQALEARLELRCAAEFSVDAALLAGLRVAIGPWLLQADLRDELQYFASGPEDVR
ncbi:MAG TPA: F0F1 ATP synthase subunit delta, partial [Burkholderiales bacterium]|nr:F0F1 ATP synthase subunit delta [Burkholderiales bacterium]